MASEAAATQEAERTRTAISPSKQTGRPLTAHETLNIKARVPGRCLVLKVLLSTYREDQKNLPLRNFDKEINKNLNRNISSDS